MPNKTLLICDDNQDILNVLILICSNDFIVTGEADSTKIEELISEHQPDILLVDLWMPLLSGDDLIRNLCSKVKC